MSILALHGFTGVGEDFAPFAELCGGTWRCPNLPGHGPEPTLDCSPEATGEQIDRERGNRTILLGYSMGARAALLHAYNHPSVWDALILISPNPGIKDEHERAERRAADEKLAQRIEAEGVAAFIEFWQSTPMIRSQQNIRKDWRAAMQAARQEHSTEGLAASLRYFGQGACPNLWPALDRLSMPVLLVTGTSDNKYQAIAQAMGARIQAARPEADCRQLHVHGAGHCPHLESPETTAQGITEFIASLGTNHTDLQKRSNAPH